ncbi:MAG: hypothetical protein IJ864_06385 [Alphaproteobacteria bacterium]|nr:hypothetical protein [Alphaproteobacteria bacterium]
MSEKAVKVKQNKPLSKKMKWFWLVLLVIVLEFGAIAAAVKISDLRTKSEGKYKNLALQVSEQNSRLETLENLPALVSNNAQKISATTHTINALSENLQNLTAEVGGNKFEQIAQKIAVVAHQVDALEELKNNDVLALCVALIIKENALYHRPFAQEISILAELSHSDQEIAKDIETLKLYQNKTLEDNNELTGQFAQIADNFNFKKAQKTEQENTVSRSIKLIKETVAGMHFDKVVVLKKERKTDREKLLLSTLNDLVNSYNYSDALDFIAQNSEFSGVENKEFSAWQEKLKQRIAFDDAISNIVAHQLKAMRQDLKEQKTNLQTESSITASQSPEENKENKTLTPENAVTVQEGADIPQEEN